MILPSFHCMACNTRAMPVLVLRSVGSHRINPRSLLSSYLGRLVCVEGIVSKCAHMHPHAFHTIKQVPMLGGSSRRLDGASKDCEERPLLRSHWVR